MGMGSKWVRVQGGQKERKYDEGRKRDMDICISEENNTHFHIREKDRKQKKEQRKRKRKAAHIVGFVDVRAFFDE